MPSEPAFTGSGTATQSDGLLVSGGSGVQVLDNRGGAGEAFGGVGSLNISPVRGKTFELGDFTIDPQGRLLVVGASLFPESENPSPFLENGARVFRPGLVRILRFLPDGHLDPTFGQRGAVETDLGLPPPPDTEGQPLGTHPALDATGVAIGPKGEVIVTGGSVFRLGETCEHDSFAPAAVFAGFVARFTKSGEPDTSFGKEGLVGGRDLSENALGAETIGDPVVSPGGGITYRSIGAYRCERDRSHLGIAQLTPGGRPRSAFGKKGAIFGPYRALAGESDGSLIALEEVPRRREGETFKARVTRIAPDGKPNAAFGKHGRATVRLGPGTGTSLEAIAVDGQGRILVGGTLGPPKGRSIVLLRVSARGKWETNFGPHGRVATRVRQLAQFRSSDLFFDPEGRLVTVHQYAEELKGRSGLLVARYLLRN